MTMRFMDGFDHHDQTTVINTSKWTSLLDVSMGSTGANQRFSGSGQYITGSNANAQINKDLGSNEASGVFGLAIRLSATASYSVAPFVLRDSTSVQIAVIVNNATRTLSIIRGTSATVLGTSSYVLPTAAYVYLELKWKINNSISSNDVILYADGVDILNLAAATDTQATANAYITNFKLGRESSVTDAGSAATWFIDDFYWLDLTGSVNNAAKGPVRVVTLVPTAVGNSSQLVNNSGNSTNNFNRVDEIPHNTDTDYVETSTPGNKDTYGYGDTPSTTNTIHAIAKNTIAKKTDASARTFKHQTRIGSTDYEGAEITLNTSYTNHQEVSEVSPATAIAFTKAEIDAAEFGSKCHA